MPTLTIVEIDPRTLVDNPTNLRKTKSELAGLTASIRESGVLEPLLVTDVDGTPRILAGHRRAAAAVLAEVATVPCIIRNDLADKAALVAAMVENVQRRDLTAAEEAEGYAQLEAFGLSAEEIAAATGSSAEHVNQHLTVSKSKVGAAVAERYDLSLEQALAIAEFEKDKRAVKKLTEVALKDPGQFDHVLSQERQDRDRKGAVDAAKAKLKADGVKVIDDRPRNYVYDKLDDRTPLELNVLGTAEKATVKLTPANHKDCPGHAAYVSIPGYSRTLEPEITYCCTAPAKNKHTRFRSSPGSRTGEKKAPETGPAADKAREERRTLFANNKAWRAAEPVRIAFARSVLARKVVPKGALRYATIEALTETYAWGQATGDMIGQLTGEKEQARHLGESSLVTLAKRLPDNKVAMALLARAFAAVETAMDVHVWRNAVGRNAEKDTKEARYLAYLVSLGYSASPVEQLVLGIKPKPAPVAKPKATPAKATAKKAPAKRAPAKATAKKAAPKKETQAQGRQRRINEAAEADIAAKAL